MGFGGKDGHRPQGSVLHVGFAGMAGTGETDLTQATWNGMNYGAFRTAQEFAVLQQARSNPSQAIQIQAGALATELAANAAYGLGDPTKVEGDGTAYLISAGYEWVLSRGAPGLGILVGAELYISQGGFESSNPAFFPSVKTEGGIGGGGVVGVSYYLRNGINFAFKTGLGAVDPGEVNFTLAPGQPTVKVEPETVFYASPTFSIGYIY